MALHGDPSFVAGDPQLRLLMTKQQQLKKNISTNNCCVFEVAVKIDFFVCDVVFARACELSLGHFSVCSL